MKKWFKKIIFMVFGGGVALAAPVIPSDNMVWTAYETVNQETGAKECFNEFYDKEGKSHINPMSCDEYWKIANTPNYPPPVKKNMDSVLTLDDAQAAIAFDASSNSGSKGTVTSFSWSHTNTGSDLLLYVGISYETDTYTPSNTTVTYNSVNLTKIRDDIHSNVAGSEAWYLANPATGANTVAVSSSDSFPWFAVAGGAISLTGVDQTSPLDANNGATGSSDSPSVNVTTVADNSWVLDTVYHRDQGNLTAGSGQTERWNLVDSFHGFAGSSEGPKVTAGFVTMDWSNDFSDEWAISAGSFAPALIVTTNAVTNIADTTADGNGETFVDTTERGFVYDTSSHDMFSGAPESDDFESFESSDLGDWTDTGASNCWNRDFNQTGTVDTGPNGPTDGSWYIYAESSSVCNGSDEDSIEYTLSTTTSGYVDFYYHMYGSDMGTLSLDAWDGSVWTEIWSRTGQQDQTDELDAYTHATSGTAFPHDTTKIRFHYTGATGAFGDAAIDEVTVYRSAPAPADSPYASSVNETGTLSPETYSLSLTGLTASTQYYVRAYAYSSTTAEYNYGDEVNFTTTAGGGGGATTPTTEPVIWFD